MISQTCQVCTLTRRTLFPVLLVLFVGGGCRFAASQSLFSGNAAVSTIAGQRRVAGSSDGIGTSATFNSPYGIAMNSAGNLALVADQTNHVIRAIYLPGGTVATLAGRRGVTGISDGIGGNSSFNTPSSVALNSDGSQALVVSGRDLRADMCARQALGVTDAPAALHSATHRRTISATPSAQSTSRLDSSRLSQASLV